LMRIFSPYFPVKGDPILTTSAPSLGQAPTHSRQPIQSAFLIVLAEWISNPSGSSCTNFAGGARISVTHQVCWADYGTIR
jgi:hypothetical protein